VLSFWLAALKIRAEGFFGKKKKGGGQTGNLDIGATDTLRVEPKRGIDGQS
jgi:hypothetical protein